MDTRSGDRRIVVGIDGSSESLAALEWAADEAHRGGGSIDAVLVHDTGLAWIDVGSDAEAAIVAHTAQLAKEALHDALDRATLPGEGTVEVTPRVVAGEAAWALIGLAHDADLLVVGTRGRGAFKGLLLGSVSQRCAEWSRCPVVVVPASRPEPHDGPPHIVVGVDGSAHSRSALTWALTEADRTGRAVDVVTAYDRGLAWIVTDETTSETIVAAAERSAESELRAALDDALDATDARPPIATSVVPGGAVRALVDAARHAEMLVVGTRGRGGFAGLLLGSVSQHCAQRSPCPVVVVPTPHAAERTTEHSQAREGTRS